MNYDDRNVSAYEYIIAYNTKECRVYGNIEQTKL